MKSGQILILILLIVVVALAVGLSVASRNITNLRTSTQTEQSQRAFSAAEGGVEDVLSRLTAIDQADPGQVGSISGKDIPVTVGDITANVNVKSNKSYEFTLKPGEVGQVNLNGYDAVGSDVKIEWINKNDPSEYTTDLTQNLASIELTFICAPPAISCLGDSPAAGQTYSQHREAWKARDGSNFPSAACGGITYDCSLTKSGVSNVKLLRIKPFWRQATIKVSGSGANASNFPVQTYEVESVATSEIGVTRRIKVTRTALEQLPAAFDYVLFSEGDIVK